MENIELVLNALKESGKPLKGGEISEITGLDKKIVDKVIKQLKTDGKITSPRRCFYQAN